MSEKEEKKKLPIDARLLSDAVIELNISRRSVSLYPPEHPITQRSIESAYGLLKKLFEIRGSITLGVAKDVLMVDEYTLDRANPVFIEFANSLFEKGIAAVTFYSGLKDDELLMLHKLITDKDTPAGPALMETMEVRELRNIKIATIDMSKLKFVEDAKKVSEEDGQTVLEEYVFGIIEGTLAGEDAEGVLLRLPPESVANIINAKYSEEVFSKDGYDRVITSYMSKKGRSGISSESINRFMSLIENLTPEIKQEFLTRAIKHQSLADTEVDNTLNNITPADAERMINIFKNLTKLPESLRNFMDKFSGLKKTEGKEDYFAVPCGHVHDLEINEKTMNLFESDEFGEYVSLHYQSDLEKMKKIRKAGYSTLSQETNRAMRADAVDYAYSNAMLEIIDCDIKKEDHLKILTRLSEIVDMFLETGRLEEVLHIYNALYPYMLKGSFKEEVESMVKYYFRSEHFISKLFEVFEIWGRDSRDAAFKLIRVLKNDLIDPLLDALEKEKRSAQRKFYLSILGRLGKDVLLAASLRLKDDRWYVVRNMIYLIREAGAVEYVNQIRPFTKHKNTKVIQEALSALVQLGDPDAPTYVRRFLRSNVPETKEFAIKLSGDYRINKVLPELIRILEKFDLFGAVIDLKHLAVIACGKIGDPAALGSLKKLLGGRSFVNTAMLDALKLEIIASLRNYPSEQVKPLLCYSLEIGKDEMRSLAQKILSEMDNG